MSIPESVHALVTRAGIAMDDAFALRRCAMTLHRWHEGECGDSNEYSSWAIERDEATGKTYRAVYPHTGKSYRVAIPDREKGARKRVAKIIARYPGLSAYVQTDPRGAALFILPPGVTEENYNRGIAVYR